VSRVDLFPFSLPLPSSRFYFLRRVENEPLTFSSSFPLSQSSTEPASRSTSTTFEKLPSDLPSPELPTVQTSPSSEPTTQLLTSISPKPPDPPSAFSELPSLPPPQLDATRTQLVETSPLTVKRISRLPSLQPSRGEDRSMLSRPERGGTPSTRAVEHLR